MRLIPGDEVLGASNGFRAFRPQWPKAVSEMRDRQQSVGSTGDIIVSVGLGCLEGQQSVELIMAWC